MRALWRRNALTVVFAIACSGSAVAHWGLDHRNGSEYSFRSIKSDFAGRSIFDFSYYNGAPWLRSGWNAVPDYGNRRRPPFTESFVFTCIYGIGSGSECGSLSQSLHEFCGGCSDPSLLAKVLLWKKYMSITRNRAFNLLNAHIINPSIGGDQIWKEFYFEAYLSSWGLSNVRDLDLNGGFYVFARNDNRLSLDHIHINPNPWSISRNQCFAINFVGLLGGAGMSVSRIGTSLSGFDCISSFRSRYVQDPGLSFPDMPQRNGEDSNHEGRNRANSLMVLSNENARTSFVPTEHETEVGDTLFKGIAGVLALGVAYALLKRF